MLASSRASNYSKNYPYLESKDIVEALRYAAELAEDGTVELAG